MMAIDFSYKNYKKSKDIHGTALYPAVMVAPIQKDILSNIIKNNNIKNVFDPFHGSGTSLYEALEINDKLNLIGCDINPLANLITKVKLIGLDKNIIADIELLKHLIFKTEKTEMHYFYNIEKWFREDIIKDLSIIRICIMSITNKNSRLYFWYILCDIVRKYSNSRSSTYKLHIKNSLDVENMKNNLIRDYIKSLEKNIQKFKKKASDVILYKCDILDKIKDFKNNSIDISITSPPYGDNATTVTYGQFSILALKWIDPNDLELEGWELDNYSIIDSKSMGGKDIDYNFDEFEEILLKPYLSKISEKKHKKVIRFFKEYFIFIKHLCRITNKYIVMTLGNRTVDGIKINLTYITQKCLSKYNFEELECAERVIPLKRIPQKTSRVNNKSVNSMTHEYIIIYKKLRSKK